MIEAFKLREFDKDYRNHLQAFLNFLVTGKKKAGKNKQKPIYRKFSQFFDYKAQLNRLTKKSAGTSRFSALSRKMKHDREEIVYAGK